jgi:hypothetical protein
MGQSHDALCAPKSKSRISLSISNFDVGSYFIKTKTSKKFMTFQNCPELYKKYSKSTWLYEVNSFLDIEAKKKPRTVSRITGVTMTHAPISGFAKRVGQ